VGSFEGLEAVHGRVVLGVGPLRGVEHIVEVLVVAEFVAEGLDLLVGGEGFRRHEEIIGSALHLRERRDFSDGAYGVLREV
jgi:hypothetical protein